MNAQRFWSISLIFIILPLIVTCYETMSNACIETSLPHLLPANMPPELKQTIFRDKTTDIGEMINLLIIYIVTNNGEKNTWKQVSNIKSYFLLNYYTKLHFGVKSLLNGLQRPTKIASISFQPEIHFAVRRINVGLGTVVILQIPRYNIKYRQERIAINFHFIVSFSQYLNTTFIPLDRKDNCNFIFCIEKVFSTFQILDKTCTIVKGSFPSWSIMLKKEIFHGKGNLYFRVYITLLYTEGDSCPNNLLQMIFQPTFLRTQSVGYESIGANFVKIQNNICKFINKFFQLLIEGNLRVTSNLMDIKVYTLRIIVPLAQKIRVTLDKYNYRHCESEQEPLFIYDGPGVLSQKIKPRTSSMRVAYQASTYQVFIFNVVEQHRDAHRCNLKYRGKHTYIKKIVKVKNDTLSYHLKSFATSKVPHCRKRSQITFCKLIFRSQQNILVNITTLRGSTCVSYSEYQRSYSDQSITMKGSGMLGVRQEKNLAVGLCYYGLVAISYLSWYRKVLQSYIKIFCTEEISQGQEIWVSANGNMEVIFYNYYPYSDLETKFHISTSKCESIAIALCIQFPTVTDHDWNGVSISSITRRESTGSGIFQDHISMHKIKMKRDDICLLLNMIQTNKGYCASNKLDILSENNNEIHASGYIRLDFFTVDYYNNEDKLRTFFHHTCCNDKNFFHLNPHQSFNTRGQSSYLKTNIGSATTTKLLNIVSAAQIYIIAKTSRKIACLPNNSIPRTQSIPELRSDTALKCFKLHVYAPGKIFFMQLHTMYSAYTYVREEQTIRENKICTLQLLLFGQKITCDNILDKITQNPSNPYKMNMNVIAKRVFNLKYCMKREIQISNALSALYVDNDVTMQGIISKYIITQYRQHGRPFINSGNITKEGRAMVQVNDLLSVGNTIVKWEEQKPGMCYNQSTQAFELFKKLNSDVVMFGKAQYKGHEYFMHFKLGKKSGVLSPCFDLMTCSNLHKYDPDLVTWSYANEHCQKNNMTLLTLGSKDEELQAVSLQSSLGRDGRRYDMQLVYLGLVTKKTGFYEWIDSTPLSYFQWNDWHYHRSANLSYQVESNTYEKQMQLRHLTDSFLNRNKFNYALESIIHKELSQKQPNTKIDYNCTASYLGDMRHSDWIKVPCDVPLTSSWICESTPSNKSSTSGLTLKLDTFCKPNQLAFAVFCLELLTVPKTSAQFSFGKSLIKNLTNYFKLIFKHHKNKVAVYDNTESVTIFKKLKNANHTSEPELAYFLYLTFDAHERSHYSCFRGFFLCNKSNKKCIAPQFVCDKDVDCPAGEDEENCDCGENIDKINCMVTRKKHFLPKHNVNKYGKLYTNVSSDVGEDAVCNPETAFTYDFHERCFFDRDHHSFSNTCPFSLHLKDCNNIFCTNSFKCPLSYCIPYRNVCDGKWDCPDGDDEHTDCHVLRCPGFLQCKSLSICVHPSEICDGKIDCKSPQMDDEIMCIQNYFCPSKCQCLGLAIQCYSVSHFDLPLEYQTSVEYLLLSFNDYMIIQTHHFSNFVSLKYLNLSHNEINEIAVHAFSQNMVSLTTLDLKGNNLQLLERHQFAGLMLAPLQWLYATKNKLKEIHEWAFSGMQHLLQLNLCCMSIYLLKDYSLSHITSLKLLNLSNNKLNLLNERIFSDSMSIKILDVSGNSLLSISPYAYQFLATLNKIFTSSSKICCALSKHTLQCVSETQNVDYLCSNPHGPVFILLRVLDVLCFVTNFAALSLFYKSNSSQRTSHLYIAIMYTMNVLLIDINNSLVFQFSETLVHFRVIVCNFTRFSCIILFQMLILNPVLNSVEVFILIFFPFRRKGIGKNNKLFVYTSVVILLTTSKLISLPLEASGTLLANETLSYIGCIGLLTHSLFQKYSSLFLLIFSFFMLLLCKGLAVHKLLIKLEKQSAVKDKFGTYIIVEAIIFSLLLLPISVIMALPYRKENVEILTNVLLILSLIVVITCNVLFAFTKVDFRKFFCWKHREMKDK